MTSMEGPEEVCAGCSLHPLEVSLVLICSHRLCLRCAYEQLQQLQVSKVTPTTQRAFAAFAACPSCGSVTEVEAGAAQQIHSLQSLQSTPSVPSVPSQMASLPSAFSTSRSEVDEMTGQGQGAKEPRPARQELQERKSAEASDRDHDRRDRSPGLPITAVASLPVLPPQSPANGNRHSECSQQDMVCGQCEVNVADVRCSQCDELFCQSCYNNMHRVGRMKEHRSSPLAAPTPRNMFAVPLQSTEYCAEHGEPLHFFCLDCTECICAECTVQRDRPHHGHDVVSAKTAFNQLLGTIRQLLESAGARLRKPPKAELIQQLDSMSSKGKQELKRSFLSLYEALKLQEQTLMKRAEEIGRTADQALLAKARQFEARSAEISRLREWTDMLRDEAGSAFVKVNLYMSVKRGLAALTEASLLD